MKRNVDFKCMKTSVACLVCTAMITASPMTALAGGSLGEMDKILYKNSGNTFSFWGDITSIVSDTEKDLSESIKEEIDSNFKRTVMELNFDKEIIRIENGDVGGHSYDAEYTVIVPDNTTVSIADNFSDDLYRQIYIEKLVLKDGSEQTSNGKWEEIDINDKTVLNKNNTEVFYEFRINIAGARLDSMVKVITETTYKKYGQNENLNDCWDKERTPEKTAVARPTSSKVLINGKDVKFQAYNIDENNYFKIRDLAMALNGTGKNFSVTWDNTKKAIAMNSNTAYTPVGGELALGDSKNKTATTSAARLYQDGSEVFLDAYTIDGNTYFKLRDIGQLFDFGVDWNGSKNCIEISTKKGYSSAQKENTANDKLVESRFTAYYSYKSFDSLSAAEQDWVKRAVQATVNEDEEIYTLLKELKKIHSTGFVRTTYGEYKIEYYADDEDEAYSIMNIEVRPENGICYYNACWGDSEVHVKGGCKDWNWDGAYEGVYDQEKDKGTAKQGRLEGEKISHRSDGDTDSGNYKNGYLVQTRYHKDNPNNIWTPTRGVYESEIDFMEDALWN